jgi:hypothetical protein
MKKKILYWFLVVWLVSTILLSLFSIVFEKDFVIAHLLVHFQFQFFILAFIPTIGLIAFKKWSTSTIGIVFLMLLYIILLHPIQFFSGSLDRVDIFFINSYYLNDDVQPIVDSIKENNPRTIAIVESNPLIVEQLKGINREPILDHRAYASSCSIFTSGHLSAEIEGRTHLPLCIVHYENYDLISVHAHRPFGEESIEENIKFFDQIAELIEVYEQSNKKFIIVGDFNATLYSSYFRDRFGKYVQKNLYTWMVETPLALPIDHVITNMDVDYVRTEDLGSDHTALLIQINE